MKSTRLKPVAGLRALLEGIVGNEDIPDTTVSNLSLDSRKVESGDAFFALAGTQHHGVEFASQAIDNGAAAIIYDPSGIDGGQLKRLINETKCPCVAVPSLGEVLGLVADRYFGWPSAELNVIGITGTNGKTSCSHYLAQALARSQPCGVIGTLGWGFIGDLEVVQNTTPDAIELHRVLAAIKGRAARYVVMEVSSHGQAQGRTQGVRFKGVIFTNITHDHLDYHKTMEAYVEAKLSLLHTSGLEFVVVNLDGGYVERIVSAVPSGVRIIGFTRQSDHGSSVARIRISALRHDVKGVAFRVHFDDEIATVSAPLFCDFNVENLLAVLGVMLELGVPLRDAAGALKSVRPVAGRLEQIATVLGAPTVVVDYAHTPDALERVLSGLRNHCVGALWLVFGCGGGRDRGKRPLMGRIAEKGSDHVLVTDDNPRSEDGEAIVKDILKGCRGRKITVLRNRKAAIERAIKLAKTDDLVVVAGKGHENTQEIKGVKYAFSDRDVVNNALKNRSSVAGALQ